MLSTPVCLFIYFYQIFYVNSYDGKVYGRANSKFFAQKEMSTFINFVKQQLTRKVLGNLFSWRTKWSPKVTLETAKKANSDNINTK